MRTVMAGLVVVAFVVAAPGAVTAAEEPVPGWPVCGEWRGPFPVPVDGSSFVLLDVAVVSPYGAWAVGGVGAEYTWKPLTLRWNDVRWERVDFPRRVGVTRVEWLEDLAVAGDEVWVVGHRDADPFGQRHTRPVAARWDGDSWRVVPFGIDWGTGSVNLQAIEAIPGTDDLWAVGYVDHGGPRTVILRWNGAAWHRADGPRDGQYTDIAAVRGMAWAVGSTRSGNRMIAARWTPGQGWITRWGPPVRVVAVDAASADSFTAVSDRAVLRVDGTSWRIARSFGPNLALEDVVVASPTDRWAVGTAWHADRANTPVMVRRSNAGWIRGPVPIDGANLRAIDGTPHNLWLVSWWGYEGGIGGEADIYHRC